MKTNRRKQALPALPVPMVTFPGTDEAEITGGLLHRTLDEGVGASVVDTTSPALAVVLTTSPCPVISSETSGSPGVLVVTFHALDPLNGSVVALNPVVEGESEADDMLEEPSVPPVAEEFRNASLAM